MKKERLSIIISVLIFFIGSCSNAEMKSQSLSIGGIDSENSSSIQTLIRSQIDNADDQVPPKIEVNETNINYITPPQYNYYPYTTIGPYGVYSNMGGLSITVPGFGFGFWGPNNRHHMAPPPPPNWKPPMPPHHGNRPPNGHPPNGNHPPNGMGSNGHK